MWSQIIPLGLVSSTDDGGGGDPPPSSPSYTKQDLYSYADFFIDPDSARTTNSSSGPVVSNGDTVFYVVDVKGKYGLSDRSDRPSDALPGGDDLYMTYLNDPNIDSSSAFRINNAPDQQFFDNTISAGDTAPYHYFFIGRWRRGAKFEKYMAGGFEISDDNFTKLGTAFNVGSDVFFPGGTGIPADNSLFVFEQVIKRSGWTILYVNGVQYGDSAQLPSLAGVKLSNMQVGSPNNNHALYLMAYFGRITGTYSDNERDSIYKRINSIWNVGGIPYGASAYNGSISFNATTNVFTATYLDTIRADATIDSIHARVYFEDETYSTGNWIFGLERKIDTVTTYESRADVLSFDRDDYPELSDGNAGSSAEYIIWRIRLYNSVTGWSDWFQTDFIINNVE